MNSSFQSILKWIVNRACRKLGIPQQCLMIKRSFLWNFSSNDHNARPAVLFYQSKTPLTLNTVIDQSENTIQTQVTDANRGKTRYDWLLIDNRWKNTHQGKNQKQRFAHLYWLGHRVVSCLIWVRHARIGSFHHLWCAYQRNFEQLLSAPLPSICNAFKIVH